MSSDSYPPYQNYYNNSQADQATQPQYSAGQGAPFTSSSSGPPKSRKKPLIIGLIVVAVLILGSVLAAVTHNFLPASAASVTFVPVHQPLYQFHTFNLAATSDFANNSVASHEVSYTTPTKSEHETTTNIVHKAPTQAKGQLAILPRNATSSGAIKNMIIPGPNGLEIDTDEPGYITLTPGKTTMVPAHIAKAGSVGNISAYFVNSDYEPGDDRGLILYIYNPAPFTGGSDGYDGPEVLASDLSQIEHDLTTELEQDALQGLQKLLKPGEGLLETKCTPHVKSQPAAGSHTANLTASGTETCTGTAYDKQGIQTWMQNDMQQQASQRFGPHLGMVKSNEPDFTMFPGSLKVYMQSDWAVKFDADGKKALAQAIAGKSQDEARSILTKQFSARTTNISVSGWGIYMPTDPAAIQFIAQDTTK